MVWTIRYENGYLEQKIEWKNKLWWSQNKSIYIKSKDVQNNTIRSFFLFCVFSSLFFFL